MKIALVFIIAVIGFNQMFGQNDQSALELLKKVEKKGLAYKTIQSKITYVLENNQENTTEKITGIIKVKGEMFSLVIDETKTYFDGKTKWVYLEESNEVNVSDIPDISEMGPEDKFMNSPLSIYNLYATDFKYKIFGMADLKNITYTVVDLTPESLDKPYFKIRYWISKDLDIYAVKYFQKDGMRISLFFDDFVANNKLKDEEFVFNSNSFPDVEIIDLR